MRIRSRARCVKALCLGVPWLALSLTLGCAHAVRPTVTAPPTTTNPPAEPPAALVNVERDAGGFTITQSGVLVTDEVRANYDAARRRLEEAQYEPGIALLLKVTEQAPTLTAAH